MHLLLNLSLVLFSHNSLSFLTRLNLVLGFGGQDTVVRGEDTERLPSVGQDLEIGEKIVDWSWLLMPNRGLLILLLSPSVILHFFPSSLSPFSPTLEFNSFLLLLLPCERKRRSVNPPPLLSPAACYIWYSNWESLLSLSRSFSLPHSENFFVVNNPPSSSFFFLRFSLVVNEWVNE